MTEKNVYRVKIHAKELTDCGFDGKTATVAEYDNIFIPLLRAKGIPEKFLNSEAPIAIEWTGAAILLEWEDGTRRRGLVIEQ